jgi:hypothetical protein
VPSLVGNAFKGDEGDVAPGAAPAVAPAASRPKK